MLLTWLAALACVPVELPPDAWPQAGCSAPAPGTGDGAEGGPAGARRAVDLEQDDGVRIRAWIRAPRRADCAAAVVLVPGGFDPGEELLRWGQAEGLLERGVAVVAFDPRGRGASEGAEDANGARGQDDLAALLRWVAAQPAVDPTRVALSSRSFGGALAAGALGRHADLAVAGWVDVESPGWLREDLAYAPDSNTAAFEALVDPDDPEAWWAAREPAGLIAGVAVPYSRLQGLPDHALVMRTAHAAAMLEEAAASPALRYNGAAVERAQLSEGYVRDHAVAGGIDPDEARVVDAVLALLAAGG